MLPQFPRFQTVARRLVQAGSCCVLAACLPQAGYAQEEAPPPAVAKEKKNGAPDPADGWPRMTLGECLAVAMERQPTIRAAQHSLTSSAIARQSLYNLPSFAAVLKRELPIRRQQSDIGLCLSTAEVTKTQQETTYDVTRLYYSYVYARQQEVTATDVIEQMEIYYKVIEEIVKSGVRDERIKANQFTLYTLREAIDGVRKQLVRAQTGRQQALAALREAMGVDDCFARFAPADRELPIMGGEVARDDVVRWALSRRPELTQAASGVDVFRLEVSAQAEQDGRLQFQTSTFASGSDIHAKLVPLPYRNGDYRPGAIAPEMPVNLAGRVDDRVARAAALSLRQDALYDKIVGLVRLEAVNAHLNFQTTARAMADAKAKFDQSRKILEEARAIAALQQDPELLIRTEGQAGRAQGEYVEAVFEHLKALATLERVTAGAVTPAFPGR